MSKTFARFGLPEHAKKVRDITERVRRVTAKAVIDQGRELAAAHEKLARYGDGTWCKWVAAECKMSRKSADNRRHAFGAFGELDLATVTQFHASAMYELASDESRIRRARERAIELARAGRTITRPKAKKLIAEIYQEERQEIDEEFKRQEGIVPRGELEPQKCQTRNAKQSGLAGVRRLREVWEAREQAYEAYRRAREEYCRAWTDAKPMERRLHDKWVEQRAGKKRSA